MHMPLEDSLGLNLLAANQHRADHNRAHFDAWNLLCLNLMSSPGAGKTSLLERSLPAPGLLAHILVSKYCDHLPLYRQERIYATRHGVELPRQTMARWVGLAADWLRPIYDLILTGVMAGGYVQVDETPIEYLDLPSTGRRRGVPLGNQPSGQVSGQASAGRL